MFREIYRWKFLLAVFHLVSQLLVFPVSSTQTTYATINLAFTYQNKEARLENGFRCHLWSQRSCDLRFEINLWNPDADEESANLFRTITKTYVNTEIVVHGGAIKLREPLPERYSLSINTKNRIQTGEFFEVSTFEALNFTVKPGNKVQIIPVKRNRRNYRNPSVKLEVKMRLECSTNTFGDRCQHYCDPLAKNYKCDSDGNRNCTYGFRGPLCETKDWCVLEPCADHETCILLEDGRRCECNPETGRTCGPNKKVCTENPCLNGAYCQPSSSSPSGFVCHCTAEWTGLLCTEPKPKEDISNLCLNGGSPREPYDGTEINCSCPPGWEGQFCEISNFQSDTVSKEVSRVGRLWETLIGLMVIFCGGIVLFMVVKRYKSSKKKGFPSKRGLAYYQRNGHNKQTDDHRRPKLYVARSRTNKFAAKYSTADSGVYEECFVDSSPLPNEEFVKLNDLNQEEAPPPLPERPYKLMIKVGLNPH